MNVPAVGEVRVQIVDGQAVMIANFGPHERDLVSVEGYVIPDAGVTVRNRKDDRLSRSIKTRFLEWVPLPK